MEEGSSRRKDHWGGRVIQNVEETSHLGVTMIVGVAEHREGDSEDLRHLFWIDP